MSDRPVLLVEDDPYPRILRVVLDPEAPADLAAAFARMLAHELPDFAGWCAAAREDAGSLYPCTVRMVGSQEALRAELGAAAAVMVESLRIGGGELALAPRLRVVQKYGTTLANIDAPACAARGVAVRTLARRACAAVAEHALAMMLMLARQLDRLNGAISVARLQALGFQPAVGARAFDARVPGSGWACVAPLAILRDATLGIVGMGETGRELATRAGAFGMRMVYTQRRRLPVEDEARFNVRYAPLDELLAESDFVSLHVPETPATRGMIGAAQLARMKPGAFLVNVARARLVERGAVIDALAAGRLGGLALDAQYEEPARADDELIGMPNVILTPHTAAQPRTIGLADFRELLAGLATHFPGREGDGAPPARKS